ncbi:MAG: GntR family transcriptional regulator [Glaciihabitans sp.]|jgi:GntR family transcriptional regulator|nr:GntR family transcriptional regulator [Glaciihabitans sp.]
MKEVHTYFTKWADAVALTHDGARPTIRADYPEPLWIQAVNLINDQIARGVLRPGMRIAPERELCQQLGISRVTLRKALTKLVADGVLSASHGRGWYVASTAPARRNEWPNTLESFSETAAHMGLTATSSILRAAEAASTVDEAEELQIAPGTRLFRLERVRLLDDVPIALDATRVPTTLVTGLDAVDFSHASLYEELASRGLEPARADAKVEARQATDDEAGLLALDKRTPLLVMRQLAFDAQNRPLFSSTIRYAGDRYRLKTQFVRSTAAGPTR